MWKKIGRHHLNVCADAPRGREKKASEKRNHECCEISEDELK
jgi:hypothetical protein